MKNNLVIIGAGGHGKVVADIAESMSCFQNIVFIDDQNNDELCCGYPIVGDSNRIEELNKDYQFFVAIGNNSIREEKMNHLLSIGAEIATIIHPSAIISKSAVINKGSVIMPGVVINADAEIGKGVIVNTGASIDHETKIGDYSHISVGVNLAGQVFIGKRSMVGAGAVVINNIDISDDCMIGAGAVVTNSLIDSGTYIGIPAKLRYRR